MADLLTAAAPLLMLALLYCGWRAGRLLLSWAPATATVWRSDYSELERQEDFWTQDDCRTARGWNLEDSADHREIDEIVTFEDRDGRRHRANVRRQVRRGWRPDGIYTIWYDPADPRRVAASGPASWLLAALLAGAALAWLFTAGAAMA